MSRYLLFLFLLLIPTQLGKHFWPSWASVQGVRVDYLSPTLYLIDVIFGLLFIFNFKWKIKNKWQWLMLGLVIVLNLISAWNKWEAVYRWLRIWEYGWIFFYIKENKEITKKFLKIILPIWIIGESLLGWIQVSWGASVNGIMYWLGERAMDLNTLGVAKWSIDGSETLRAYGTFSHPNSLAGFLLVAILLWSKPLYRLKSASPLDRGEVKNVFWWVVWWTGILGIVICGSRNVWGVGLVILFYELYKKNKYYLIGIPILIGIGAVNFNLFSGWDPTSLKKRWELMVAAVAMIKEAMFLGVGAGNFLVRLPEHKVSSPVFWLQPVHNVYLLLLSELGLLGIMALAWISKINVKKIIRSLPIVAILLTAVIDHYWVTLPQNIWLVVLVLGLI